MLPGLVRRAAMAARGARTLHSIRTTLAGQDGEVDQGGVASKEFKQTLVLKKEPEESKANDNDLLREVNKIGEQGWPPPTSTTLESLKNMKRFYEGIKNGQDNQR